MRSMYEMIFIALANNFAIKIFGLVIVMFRMGGWNRTLQLVRKDIKGLNIFDVWQKRKESSLPRDRWAGRRKFEINLEQNVFNCRLFVLVYLYVAFCFNDSSHYRKIALCLIENCVCVFLTYPWSFAFDKPTKNKKIKDKHVCWTKRNETIK